MKLGRSSPEGDRSESPILSLAMTGERSSPEIYWTTSSEDGSHLWGSSRPAGSLVPPTKSCVRGAFALPRDYLNPFPLAGSARPSAPRCFYASSAGLSLHLDLLDIELLGFLKRLDELVLTS